MKTKNETRISSIESFRLIATFAVVVIHLSPFYAMGSVDSRYKILAYMMMSVCRFAVPFFFLCGGYFFGKNIQKNGQPANLFWKSFKRLGILFLAWSFIYVFLPRFPYAGGDYWVWLGSGPPAALLKVRGDFVNFVFEGTNVVLWFLTALIFAYAVLTFFVLKKKTIFLFPLSVFLFIFGMLNSFYAPTPIGIHLPYDFHFRNGPFFSLLFVYLGWWFSHFKKPPLNTAAALLCMLIGFLVQEAEVLIISKHYNVSPNFDYVLGTIPFAVGFFLLAIASPRIGENTFLSRWGGYTLGIYLIHPAIKVFVVSLAAFINPFFWHGISAFVVFLISVLFVYFFKKSKPLQFLVA